LEERLLEQLGFTYESTEWIDAWQLGGQDDARNLDEE
jgi:hypothetical protein